VYQASRSFRAQHGRRSHGRGEIENIRRPSGQNLCGDHARGLCCFGHEGWAQPKAAETRQQIVALWKLVSSFNTAKDGTVTKGISFGPNLQAGSYLPAAATYVTVNTKPKSTEVCVRQPAQGTAEENKAVERSIAGFGPIRQRRRQILTMKQEGGTWALRNGVEEKRSFALSGTT